MMNDDLMDAGSSSDSDGGSSPALVSESRSFERTSSSGSSSRLGFGLGPFAPEGFGSHLGGGSSKRRGGLSFGGSSRDAKSRRREDSFGLGLGRRGPPSLQWDAREPGTVLRQKDELVDAPLVDTLRTQFGDPFDDRVLQVPK
ncbi:hypothetical protein DAEQUDRAFT_815291 [Daedalea quercina L-15889]|uniref:Uncharacterized protein n=1 Tax=Daedalea quercina L-15889 TaxID=1314783 RepID=A0A165L6H1_9APHY|nr:hypothetical protein DAEQUDRAFT_815291 [Daedalea quercina L-15889]